MVTRLSARARRDAFEALADPTRRAIVERLWSGGELSAGALADAFRSISRPAVSRHLRVLRSAGVLRMRREGRVRFYALDARGIADLDAWVERYRATWQRRFSVVPGAAA
jgi:DNA-binding transcriptional ArsR family regulator